MVQELCFFLLKITAVYFLTVNLVYGALMLLSWLKIRNYQKSLLTKFDSHELPPVSFLVPAFNEESLIVETIQTYLSLPQVKKEIIVVDDGSHDKTMKLLKVMYQLQKSNDPSGRLYQSITHPGLKVVEAQHGGKATALNFGLRFTQYDLICTMDADTIPTARGVEACLRSFAQDKKLIASGGVIHVLPGEILKNNSPLLGNSNTWLTAFQRIEYLRAFVCERLGWSYLGSTILISGAFCMMKKEAIYKIGGFSPRSITEDFDLIVRLRKAYRGRNHHFEILPVTTCYTQAPKTLRHLSRQRMRWQLGLIQTLFQNGSLFLHPSHGFLGMLAIPYFWIVEAFSPLMALTAWTIVPMALMSGWIDIQNVFFYLGMGLIFNICLTMMGMMIDRRYVSKTNSWPLVPTMIQTAALHMGYKQLTNWWRLLSVMKSMTKAPTWGEKPRAEIIHS